MVMVQIPSATTRGPAFTKRKTTRSTRDRNNTANSEPNDTLTYTVTHSKIRIRLRNYDKNMRTIFLKNFLYFFLLDEVTK